MGAGLAGAFERHPPRPHTVLKVTSVVYLLYLAWRIANAAPPRAGEARGRPFTFLQAAAFQWVNPKAWAMALTAVTVYTESRSLAEIVFVAAFFGAVNLPSVGSWTLLGQAMRRLLDEPGRLRRFNVTMALLLVASLYPVLFRLSAGALSLSPHVGSSDMTGASGASGAIGSSGVPSEARLDHLVVGAASLDAGAGGVRSERAVSRCRRAVGTR